MSYMSGCANQNRKKSQYINMFFHVLDQGFGEVSRYDRQIFNAIRKGVLEEDYTDTDKETLKGIRCSNIVIEEVKKRCREEHIVKLKNKDYKSSKRNRKRKFDDTTLADMYIDYMTGEQVSKKYKVNPKSVVTYISYIRHKPQYEGVRSILLSKGVNLAEKKSFKKHPPKVTMRNDEVTVNNVFTPKSLSSLRNSLLELATTKEAINLFVTNRDALHAFYDLLNSLS